ncbi:membrane-associated protein, putative [Bodo saltans]|uniref:Membrane-associated protein, putative n=1 Tax=Bodo saltans TaxID=75058 RepID=A0A0S4J2X7_BODSA|nr:membrane-associated protein, putative [Bodo saltans]|eukprot:CUG25555.1 membrane-associated protein, putative [Bodo saltans]
MYFTSFTLTGGSSFVVSTGTFSGSLGVPFYLDSSFTISTTSIFSIQDTDSYCLRGMIAPASITVTSSSVFAWNNVFFNLCSTDCMQFSGAIAIRSQSVFLLYKIQIDSSGNGIVFTTTFSVSSSSYWMIRGNVITFGGSGKYAIYSAAAVSITSSSYFVLGNNLFDATPFSLSLSLSSSISMAQCNSAGGAALQNTGNYDNLNGLQTAYVCSTCLQREIACFFPLSSSITGACDCVCLGIGIGEPLGFCLPARVPTVKVGCVQTDTISASDATNQVTRTETQTFTPIMTLTPRYFTETLTVSDELTRSETFSTSLTATQSAGSPSDEPSMTKTHHTRSPFSASAPQSETVTPRPTLSASSSFEFGTRTLTDTLTISRSLTPTQKSASPIDSSTFSFSDEGTPSVSCSPELSDTAHSVTATPTDSGTISPSPEAKSKTITDTDEPTQSRSVSSSFSDIDSSTNSPSTTDSSMPSASRSQSESSESSISKTIIVTKSWEPSASKRLTPSNSIIPTPTSSEAKSESETPSPSTSDTLSLSDTPTITETETPSKSDTLSLTSSWCMWYDLPINATPPLFSVPGVNETMTIDYYQYSRHGCDFLLPNTGQWYVLNVSYGGIAPVVIVTPREIAYAFNVSVSPPATLYHPQIFRDIIVEITFRCAVINHTVWFILRVPPSYAIAPYDAEEVTMAAAAGLAMIVTTTTSCAFFATTSITLGVLMMCRPPEEVTEFSILPLTIGDELSKNMRGAIIGNVFILGCGLVAIASIVMWTIACYNSRQLLDAEDETYLFPSRRKAILRARLAKAAARGGGQEEGIGEQQQEANHSSGVTINDLLSNHAAAGDDEDMMMFLSTSSPATAAAAGAKQLRTEKIDALGDANNNRSSSSNNAAAVGGEPTTFTNIFGSSTTSQPVGDDKVGGVGEGGQLVVTTNSEVDQSPQQTVTRTSRRRRLPKFLSCLECLRPSKRFHAEWKRLRVMTGFPLAIGHPAACTVLQPSVAAGIALYRMQASPPDNALGTFAVLIGICYVVYAYWCMKRLYLYMFGEMAYQEELPKWFWDDLLGAELRRRLGIYLKKKKRRIRKKKKSYKELMEMEEERKKREQALADGTAAEEGMQPVDASRKSDVDGEGAGKTAASDQQDGKPRLDFGLAEDKFKDSDDENEKKKKEEKEKEKKPPKVVKPPTKLSHSEACLFLGLRLPWYGLMRIAISGIYGVAVGTPPVSSDVCSLQVWIIALTTIVHTLLLLYFNPFWERSEQYLSIANCLSILCMCGCLTVATSSEEHQEVSVDGASVCLLLILIFAILHGFAHFYHNHNRLYEVWLALIRKKAMPELPPPPPKPLSAPSSSSSEEEEEEEESESSDDDYVRELQETEMLRKAKSAEKSAARTDLERIYRHGDDDGGDDDDGLDFFGMIGGDPIQLSRKSFLKAHGEDDEDDEDEPPAHNPEDEDDDDDEGDGYDDGEDTPPPPQHEDGNDSDEYEEDL